MNSKKANRAFLITTISYIALLYFVAYCAPELANNIFSSNFLVEAIVILPILLYMFIAKEKPLSFIGFHKMKISSLFMVALFTFLSVPFITVLNLISQFWVENTAVSMMETLNIAQMPLGTVLLSTAVMAPLFEEVACRGLYYRSYRKSGSAFVAMILSALIFAAIHMNFNQAAYAFGMGIMAILLIEATGSLWASILYHGLINGSQTLMIYSALKISPNLYSEQMDLITQNTIMMSLAVYLVLAAITLPLAWAVLIWISGNEGKREELAAIWKIRKQKSVQTEQNKQTKKDKMLTVPLILGLILSVAMMTGILPMIINKIILASYFYN